MFCINIIKGLYKWSPQLLRNPTALDHSSFDSGDAAVTLLRIVIAGIDHNDVVRHPGEQIARQVWNVFLWNGYDYNLATLGCLMDSYWCGAGLRRQIRESFGAA